MKQERNLLDGRVTSSEFLEGIYHPKRLSGALSRYYRTYVQRPFGKYEGSPIFIPHWRDKLLKKILSQPNLLQAIYELSSRQVAKELGVIDERNQELLRQKYENWLTEIVEDLASKALPCMESEMVVRFMYHTVAEIFSRSYHQGMHVKESDVIRVKRKMKEIESKKQSLLLFPCHKSHVDYVSLVFAFYNLGISLPCTIAGDNLDIPILSYFLRHVGATYIRRGNWSEDPLYTAFFQALLNTLLSEGLNLQCFIEGTRSRTGKLLPPRIGILRMILEAIINGVIEDAWILPISTHYDKVLEADDFATQLLGRTKKVESLKSFLESVTMVSLRLGRIDIRLGEIWSLREYVIDQLQLESVASFPLTQSLSQGRIQRLARSLGYRILNDVNKVSIIVPSALVGTVLLTSGFRGLSRHELMYRVSQLIILVLEAGGTLGGIAKPAEQLTGNDIASVVDNAVNVLGSDLIKVENEGLYTPVYHANDAFKLSYYRNQTIHLFARKSAVCVALYTLSQKNHSLRIPYSELEKRTRFLSQLLAGELIFENNDLDANLVSSLKELQSQGIVHYSDGVIEIYAGDGGLAKERGSFYCHFLWPFIDAYWNVSFTLLLLSPSLASGMSERKFCQECQKIARTLYVEGRLQFSEACSSELIKNGVLAFERLGVVTRRKPDTKTSSGYILKLTAGYRGEMDNYVLNSQLFDLSDAIANSRYIFADIGRVNSTLTRKLIQDCAYIVSSLNVSKL